MSGKQVVTIVLILLAAVLVVGLILCRPMAATNYADGIFNFAAVDGVFLWGWEYAPEGTAPEELLISAEDKALTSLTELFEGRGFGMTPGGLFSQKLPEPQAGDICWRVTFHCTVSDSTLTAEYQGGVLRLSGNGETVVTTQDKSSWARRVFTLIESMYPEPEPEPEEGADDTTQAQG